MLDPAKKEEKTSTGEIPGKEILPIKASSEFIAFNIFFVLAMVVLVFMIFEVASFDVPDF